MALLCVHGPIKKLADDRGEHELDGETVIELLQRLEDDHPVEFALRDPRTQRLLAATTSPFYGPKIWLLDEGESEWRQAQGIELPEDAGEALVRIWVIAAGEGEGEGELYAGGDPGVLFESRDGGEHWELNRALWEHRVRESWQPGGGGLCVHSIAPWPGAPERLTVGVSAAGV